MEKMSNLIERQAAIDALKRLQRDISKYYTELDPMVMAGCGYIGDCIGEIQALPSAQREIVRCKDCKHWRRQTNYAGALLSFGFCESEDMWVSLYGETCEVEHIDTDDNHYCGYAERITDG